MKFTGTLAMLVCTSACTSAFAPPTWRSHGYQPNKGVFATVPDLNLQTLDTLASAVPHSRDHSKEERVARALLASRLECRQESLRLRDFAQVGPKPPSRTKIQLPSRDPIKAEKLSRQLLTLRYKSEAASKPVPDVGPKPTPRIKMDLPARNWSKEELLSRTLLKLRYQIEAASKPVPDVGPKPTPRIKIDLPARNWSKEELLSRTLLKLRYQIEAASKPVPDVGPKPTPRIKIELPSRNPIKEEGTSRAILLARLEFDAKVRKLQEAAKLAREAEIRRLLSMEQERQQRVLLKARLDVKAAEYAALQAELAAMEARREAIRKARMQPKPPSDEQRLAAKYGSIDSLEDRAFQILVDLGLVQVSNL